MSQTNDCLIRQANCGRVAGEPICPKCGLDANARYVSEESGLLAVSKAEARYWQYEAAQMRSIEERRKLETEVKQKAEEATKQAESELLIKAQLEQAEAQLLAAEQAQNELLAQQRRNRWQNRIAGIALVLVVIGMLVYLTLVKNQSRERAVFPQQAVAELSRDAALNILIHGAATSDAQTVSAKDCDVCPEMVVVPSGSFQMGSNDSDAPSDEKLVHSVNVKSFAIGKYEVTQGQWRAVMGSNPSRFTSCGDNCPVEQVSWNDIQSYIQKLNQKTGQQYRLPSEAEWEYACRGGQHQLFCGSNEVSSVAWHLGNSGRTTRQVGQKAPNEFGLYDMSGNVWEWTEDWYHDSYSGAPSDGSAWVSGGGQKYRVVRGGTWGSDSWVARSAIRVSISPDDRYSYNGFRLAMAVP